ncbi:MAG: type III pantothenate kinase [Myxococcales bacterium]|nr:type III pantothenate kinase [Myxococcales bacterium]MCB9532062.1 type III pantothenate kinase [Myxococcales bacterium]
MLLVIDIGNTNIVLGTYDGANLTQHWRVQTDTRRTSDEYGVLIRQLFASASLSPRAVTGAILASVVPPMESLIVAMVEDYFGMRPLIVGPGVKTGMPILYENPREVGADRVVNAVAAFERTRAATLVVDFGTATTFDAISAKGEYLGGAICPGVSISADALYQRASKLPRVDVVAPARVIGRNTVASMQAGIVFGYVALVDGMVARFDEEYGARMRVLATGGLGGLFAEHCVRIEEFDPDLTLDGLRILFERNQPNPGHV